jgi:hypothetical protein
VAYITNLLQTNWIPAWRVPLTNLYETFVATASQPQVFFEAWEFSANPPILDLNSSAPTNFEMVVYGQKTSNYVIMTGTNLATPSNWTPMAGFTLSNSFQFINVSSPTNPAQFFRAERP